MQISGYDVKVNGKYHISNGAFCPEQSGTYIEFQGKVRKITASIQGITHECPAYIACMVRKNDDLVGAFDVHFFEVNDGIHDVVLLDNESDESVTVCIMKVTESQYGEVAFNSISIDGETEPGKDNDDKILFIGDSLTCGYGVDGRDGEEFYTDTENFIHAYPYLVAEGLGADYDTLCWSGDGIISRWIPEEVDAPLTVELIPDLFEREIERPEERKKSYSCIIVNIGTNDASYTRGMPDREQLFAEKYGAFLRKVHEVYKDAQIVVVYGIMEKSLSRSISYMVSRLKRTGLPVEYLDVSDDYALDGVCGHPGVDDHKKISERIISWFVDGI